jgi:thioredoxin 1
MPTFLIFKESREIKRIRGADARALREAIDTVIAGAGSAGSSTPFSTKGHTLGSAPTAPKYVSDGRIVGGVPLTAQLNGFMNTVIRFVGLYVVSLFSVGIFGFLCAVQSPGFANTG